MFDLVFRNARVVDGTGAPWFHADVAVEGDRIARIGTMSDATARRTVDVAGNVLAPGFVDLHTHSDFTLPLFPRAEAMVRQGVTTQLVGNCGFSPFPLRNDRLDLLRSYASFLDAGLPWDWKDVAGYLVFLERLPLACNVALQVGHGAVRIAVMGFESRPPRPSELAQMETFVARAMEAGVFGLSSGLVYPPGSYAATEELAALARVASRYGAFYSTHIRSEGDLLLEAIDEALTVGRQAEVPVQISHLKASARRNWGRTKEALDMIDRARAAGQDVMADQHPYAAGSTTLAAILPQRLMGGGIEQMLARLQDPDQRARVAQEVAELRTDFDLDTIMIGYVPGDTNKQYEGMMLTEVAALRGEPPAMAALHLLQAERGSIQMISFGMCEDDVRAVMRHPAVAVASDGWTLSPAAGGKPHPRSYGTYSRVLGKYVREEQMLTLEEAVRKMTSLPAGRLRMHDLGLIRPGFRADLVVFDPERISERATYRDPHRFCDGVMNVMANGQLVIDGGQDTGARAGRVLRRDVEQLRR